MSQVIIVTGASCTGKSTVVKKFCKVSKELFYRISLDDFYEMLPLDNANVIEDDYIYQTYRLMCHVIKYLIMEGKNVIVDTILLHKEEHKIIIREIEKVLENQKVLLVKLKCNMCELKSRAEVRGDRDFNLIQRQVAMGFDDGCFDLILDTSAGVLDENIRMLTEKKDTCSSYNQIGRLVRLMEMEE